MASRATVSANRIVFFRIMVNSPLKGLALGFCGSIDVRFPHGARAKAIGLLVAHELLFDRVELQAPLQPHADVGRMHRGHGVVHHLRVGDRPLAALHAVDEVPHVVQRAAGAGDVLADDALVLAQAGPARKHRASR